MRSKFPQKIKLFNQMKFSTDSQIGQFKWRFGPRALTHSLQFISSRIIALAALGSTLLLTVGEGTYANEPYLRFGIGLDRPTKTYFHDVDRRLRGALYGCAPGRDGFAVCRSVGDFRNVPVIELGVGYPRGRTRLEFMVEYRPIFSFKGNATYNYNVSQIATARNISTLSSMVVGYYDFRNDSNLDESKAVPFVGAGIGVTHNKMDDFQIRFPITTTTVPGSVKNELAWMITAGIGYKLDERKTLDLSWRYTDLGSLYTGRGNGRVNNNRTGNNVANLNQLPTVARLRGHGIRLSLRIKM